MIQQGTSTVKAYPCSAMHENRDFLPRNKKKIGKSKKKVEFKESTMVMYEYDSSEEGDIASVNESESNEDEDYGQEGMFPFEEEVSILEEMLSDDRVEIESQDKDGVESQIIEEEIPSKESEEETLSEVEDTGEDTFPEIH